MLTKHLTNFTRLQATILHFLASAIAISAIFGFVKFIWYPGPLFNIANGIELMKILVLVDLVLGPTIMFIIFNPKKPKLKSDILIVLVCQLGFMAYGAWSLYVVRPVYYAFVDSQFIMVTAKEIDEADQAKAKYSDFQSLPQLKPMFVGTKLPDSIKERNDIVFASFGGMGIHNLPQHYVPFSEIKADLLKASKAIAEFNNIDAESKTKLQEFQSEAEKQGKKIAFCPMRVKAKFVYFAVDMSNGDIIAMI